MTMSASGEAGAEARRRLVGLGADALDAVVAAGERTAWPRPLKDLVADLLAADPAGVGDRLLDLLETAIAADEERASFLGEAILAAWPEPSTRALQLLDQQFGAEKPLSWLAHCAYTGLCGGWEGGPPLPPPGERFPAPASLIELYLDDLAGERSDELIDRDRFLLAQFHRAADRVEARLLDVDDPARPWLLDTLSRLPALLAVYDPGHFGAAEVELARRAKVWLTSDQPAVADLGALLAVRHRRRRGRAGLARARRHVTRAWPSRRARRSPLWPGAGLRPSRPAPGDDERGARGALPATFVRRRLISSAGHGVPGGKRLRARRGAGGRRAGGQPRHSGRAHAAGPASLLARVPLRPAGDRAAALEVAPDPRAVRPHHAAEELGRALPQGVGRRGLAAAHRSPAPGARHRASACATQLGPRVHVALGMRYGEPSIAGALAELAARGCRRIAVLPLYPQYSATTTASTFDAVFAELPRWRWVPELRTIASYHDEPAYVAELAASIRELWQRDGEPEKLLFSFHGIPLRYFLAGDPYHCQCQKTARLVADELGLDEGRWLVTFQCLFGKEEWLQPYTDATVPAWAASVRPASTWCARAFRRLPGDAGGDRRPEP